MANTSGLLWHKSGMKNLSTQCKVSSVQWSKWHLRSVKLLPSCQREPATLAVQLCGILAFPFSIPIRIGSPFLCFRSLIFNPGFDLISHHLSWILVSNPKSSVCFNWEFKDPTSQYSNFQGCSWQWHWGTGINLWWFITVLRSCERVDFPQRISMGSGRGLSLSCLIELFHKIWSQRWFSHLGWTEFPLGIYPYRGLAVLGNMWYSEYFGNYLIL